MSKYVVWSQIEFKNQALLVKALESMGHKVEQGEILKLHGYGSDRMLPCQVVVRKAEGGFVFGDLGFYSTPKGLVPIVDHTDERIVNGGRFVVALKTAYNEQVVKEMTRRLHGQAMTSRDGHLTKTVVRYA